MRKIIISTFYIAVIGLVSGCSTGIETTAPIKMTGAEKKAALPSAEEEFASGLYATPLKEWKRGKRFIVSDNKAAYILESEQSNEQDSLKGINLAFEGISLRTMPDGGEECRLVFTDGNKKWIYSTGRDKIFVVNALLSSDIPMIIDMELVEKADSMLRGKTLWTRTGLWYADNKICESGRKYARINVDSVTSGNEWCPLKVFFTDGNGVSASLMMELNKSNRAAKDSRAFSKLFSFTDPRLKYQNISDEVWDNICSGKVQLGMTKEECRLALGNPKEVDAGHDWNATLDIWKYTDGKCLVFRDGALVRIVN